MRYPIAVHCPIAVHGPISGPNDLYRAVDRNSGRSKRSKRLEFRFAVAVHGPITVQPEFFQFPRRNVRLGISLSTDFCAFSSFRRETCESTSVSALIFVPFQEQEKVWRGLLGENYNHIAARGFGRAKPAISVAKPPPPSAPSAVELAPSARQ